MMPPLPAGLWHHADCDGNCMSCLIDALVLREYGTQGIEWLYTHILYAAARREPDNDSPG